MSLGGYKFRGYYCQKGSLTDAQWALLMHKTKVAAFMAANTAASAGWEYDMTGSPDGNYHCLDSVGNNYVTCFKRVVDADTTHYFCILTLTKYGGTNVTTAGYVATNRFCYVNNSSCLGPYYCSNFIRFGTVQISYSTAISTWLSGQTLLLPVSNLGYVVNNWYDGSTYDGSNSLFSATTNYYGYAVKGSDIIILSGPNMSGCSISVVSMDAFSSKFSDGNNMLEDGFYLNLQSYSSYDNSYENKSGYSANGSDTVVMVSAINGGQFGTDTASFIMSSPVSSYAGQAPAYPFQSVTAFSVICDSVTKTSARGVIKSELLSINYPPSSSSVSKFSTWAGGKLLALYTHTKSAPVSLFGASNTPNDQQFQTYVTYVGWDPSNPDITQASAWTEYTA